MNVNVNGFSYMEAFEKVGTCVTPEQLCASLRTRSFAVVPLPLSVSSAVRSLVAEMPHFFGDENARERIGLTHPAFASDGTPTYRGYSESDARKVLFARLTSSATCSPSPVALPSLQEACRELHAFSLSLLEALAMELVRSDPKTLTRLADPIPSASADGAAPAELSSLLSLFRYRPGAATPCAEHVDYTLITVAPFASAAGLEVLDLAEFCWRCPEKEAEGNGFAGGTHAMNAIVMAGETLEYITRGKISATTHRVVPAFGAVPRFSSPYLLYPRGDVRLARCVVQPSSCGEEPEAPIAQHFIRASQLQKTSAVYS